MNGFFFSREAPLWADTHVEGTQAALKGTGHLRPLNSTMTSLSPVCAITRAEVLSPKKNYRIDPGPEDFLHQVLVIERYN